MGVVVRNYWIIAIVSYIGASVVGHYVDQVGRTMGSRIFVPPPKGIEHFTFGYRDVLADLIWIRSLQDFDYCEGGPLTKERAEQNAEINKQIYSYDSTLEGILAVKLPPPRCKKGWLFQMMDAATDLSPKFRMIYRAGAISLSVMVDDREGAAVIFEKGVREFPDDWLIAYRAAYHFLYEMQDAKRAGVYMLQAGRSGAPEWVRSLASRLLEKEGQIELGIRALQELYDSLPEGEYRDSIKARLEAALSQLERSQKK